MTAKAYRLLCSILMTAVTSECPTRSAAEAALRAMGKNGRPITTMTGATGP